MNFGSVTIVVSVILWSALVRTAISLSFDCDPDYGCEIRNWNPSEEGTFVLDHIPNTHGALELHDLLVSSATSKLFDIFEASRKDMSTTVAVKTSPIHSFVLKDSATFKAVEFEKTNLRSILFEKNCSLVYLKIKHSKLSHLPSSIQELKNLTRLTISHSYIQAIDLNVISKLSRLMLLDLTKNRIHSLYCTAENALFATLDNFYLRDNRLKSINMNLFNAMTSLESIDLSHNLISVISGSLVSRNLKFLDLSFNRLFKLDCCKWNVPNLRNVLVNDNLIVSLSRCIKQAFTYVAFLNLDNNQLHPDELFVIGRFENLQGLTLKNNKLTDVTLNESTIPLKMNVLNLSNNKLRRLEIPYVPNKEVYIDVSSNCISNVDWDNISPNLTKLGMAGNPLDCNFDDTPNFHIRANRNSVCKENRNKNCDESES